MREKESTKRDNHPSKPANTGTVKQGAKFEQVRSNEGLVETKGVCSKKKSCVGGFNSLVGE